MTGYSPWGHKELDLTEWRAISLFTFSICTRPPHKQIVNERKYLLIQLSQLLNELSQHYFTDIMAETYLSDSLWPHGLEHTRPSSPGVYSNSRPLSQWCHLTISSSVVPFSSQLQSFPASGSFPMSQFFASGGQSTGVSALASVLPKNIQDSFPLGWTGWISLQTKGLSRVFSNTTVQKHQFFSAQLSL